jgi:hypothetical protein
VAVPEGTVTTGWDVVRLDAVARPTANAATTSTSATVRATAIRMVARVGPAVAGAAIVVAVIEGSLLVGPR